jgi:hypothetical protein
MRNTVPMPPAEKTPERIAAGEALQEWRINTFSFSSQQAFADAIGTSRRQVAAAENGEYIGGPTKRRIEDGLGWERGDWDRFVATGEHPPVVPRTPVSAGPASDREAEPVPRLVLMSPEEIAEIALDMAKESPVDAKRFFSMAVKLREEWIRRRREGNSGAESSGEAAS